MFEGLKRHGADIAICTMSAAAVVVNFNIFKQVPQSKGHVFYEQL